LLYFAFVGKFTFYFVAQGRNNIEGRLRLLKRHLTYRGIAE
jgi:hypothetical protein